MGETRYYVTRNSELPTLLRRSGALDEVFVDDGWQPTSRIMAVDLAADSPVEAISELEARMLAPAAFMSMRRAPGPSLSQRLAAALRRDPRRERWG
jgi:hypothetical protein